MLMAALACAPALADVLRSQTPASENVPLVDHHAHLVSRAARLHLIDAPLPSVTLPPDLERVFRDYERILRTGDARALAELFTEDGLIPGPDGWIRGRKGIRLAQLGSSSDLPLRALSSAVDDSVAYTGPGAFAATAGVQRASYMTDGTVDHDAVRRLLLGLVTRSPKAHLHRRANLTLSSQLQPPHRAG